MDEFEQISSDYENFAGSFDPDNFDPENFDEYAPKRQPMKRAGIRVPMAQFDIQIVNAQAAKLEIELFNNFRSVSKILNAASSLLNPFTPQSVAAANDNSLIYFDRNGSLVYKDAAAALCTISGKGNVPYRAIFEASAVSPFLIQKMRVAVTTDNQIANNITHFSKSFLGGVTENEISVRSYFRPEQQQSKIIDVPASFRIDGEKGLRFTVEAGETMTLSLFLLDYRKTADAKMLG